MSVYKVKVNNRLPVQSPPFQTYSSSSREIVTCLPARSRCAPQILHKTGDIQAPQQLTQPRQLEITQVPKTDSVSGINGFETGY